MSPENSEDGNHPPVADTNQGQTSLFHGNALGIQGLSQLAPALNLNQNQFNLQQHIQSLSQMPGVVGSMHQNQVNAAPTMIFHDHSAGHDAKRQRVDAAAAASDPILQMQAAAQVQGMINVQQLAVAAMQQQGRTRKKSQAQIDRRRERNRILARRTRLRKKFFFEALQKEVMDLQRENMRLKGIVKDEISSPEGQKLLDECDAAERMPANVLEACGDFEDGLDMQDYNLVQSIKYSQQSFIITDPSLTDNPIVFASDDFLQLTGYSREQVLGRNCRFLQGTDTNVETVQEISKAVSEGEDVSVTMLNYTADGTPFWNRLFIAALRDAQNNIVNFIGVIVKVPGPEGEGAEDQDDDEEEAEGDNKDCAAQNSADNDGEVKYSSIGDSYAAVMAGPNP